MAEEVDFVHQIKNDKNKANVRCQFCRSLILKAQEGNYCQQEIDVPLMRQPQETLPETMQTESLTHFWLVKDVMTFENIGFSHTVSGRKFLVCADCERGPVGYHDVNSKHSYLALQRVVHADK